MNKSKPILNSHVKHTSRANDPHATHWVVTDTWAFDTLEHAFETRDEADKFAGVQNQASNTLYRWISREREGTF